MTTTTKSEIPSTTTRRPQPGDLVILGHRDPRFPMVGQPGMYLLDHLDLDENGEITTYWLRTFEAASEWGTSTTGFPPGRIAGVYASLIETAG
jgi:hypothetical protein